MNNQLPNVPYFNPLLQAPQSIDPRLQQRNQTEQPISITRNQPMMPSQHWGPTNPQAFAPDHLQQRPTNNRRETQTNETWTPWLNNQQNKPYQPPDWSILSMPTSTRGHLSEGAPTRSQGPPQWGQEQLASNPLLQWERPQDPRFIEQQSSQQSNRFENKNEITDIWKRAEMVQNNNHQVNEDAIRLTRGLNTR